MRNYLQMLCLLIACGAVVTWQLLDNADKSTLLPADLEPFALDSRPPGDRYLFDYAGAVAHYDEGAHRYLASIRTRFHIEALIVSVPALPPGYSTSTLANDLVNRWRIGADFEGRGLLLLLVDDSREVKLEVTYQLEDVFTDSFSGFVEDLQLAPYYRAGDVGTGLIAVMELLEQRAAIKHQGAYTPGQIAQADSELLAGGAGAARSLTRYNEPQPASSQAPGRGARSPEQAWEILLRQWAGEGDDIEVDVYTAMSRMAMGDPKHPDPRALQALDHWRGASYQVRRDGAHAVIWFGAVDGWNNAPFLFCDTGEGWKFDIVHQRRLVVMADAPRWQVSQGPYPYVALMSEAQQSTAKDLPLASGDLYRCADDADMAARMAQLNAELTRNAELVGPTMELLRLNVITGQRPNLVQPLISRAKQLAPRQAEPYKYAAIYHTNTFLQHATALKEIETFLELEPKAVFGHNTKGFLLYRLARYQDSIDALRHAAALAPNDAYAHALMARNYMLLARNANGLTKQKLQNQALAMQRKAAAASKSDSQRLRWLEHWLVGRFG